MPIYSSYSFFLFFLILPLLDEGACKLVNLPVLLLAIPATIGPTATIAAALQIRLFITEGIVFLHAIVTLGWVLAHFFTKLSEIGTIYNKTLFHK
jgi:hypothetical protein